MKITKAETKAHDEALALLSLTRTLTYDEKEFVFQNFNPMATNNVGKGAIFFTPLELAWEFAISSSTDGNVIDLAAGIGVLSYAHRGYIAHKCRHVAIELNPEFVEIGRKLLPEVEWYCGSIFDQDLLKSIGTDFTVAISNPPYGNIPSKTDIDWMLLRGPAELLAIEISLRMAYCGGIFILPETYSDHKENDGRVMHKDGTFMGIIDRTPNSNMKKLKETFPGIYLQPWFSSIYKDVKWQGVTPNVLIIDINPDDVTYDRPYGLETFQNQPSLF